MYEPESESITDSYPLARLEQSNWTRPRARADSTEDAKDGEGRKPLRKKVAKPQPGAASTTLLAYFGEVSHYSLLSREEEVALAQRGDQQARSKLVVSNLRLVISFAKKFLNRGLDMEDLIQEGNLGLIRAAELYDPGKGTRFSTYASRWIIQALSRAVDNKSRAIRLPVTINRDIRAVERKIGLYQRLHGRRPSPEQIAGLAKLSLKRVNNALESMPAPLSLDHPLGPDGDVELGDTVASADSWDVERAVDRRLNGAEVKVLLECLTDEERFVIVHRFGLFDADKLSIRDLCNRLDATDGSVRHTYRRALEKLRKRQRFLSRKNSLEVNRKGKFVI